MNPVRTGRAVALLVSAALLAAATACARAPDPTDVTSDVDRHRADVLSSDPILNVAVAPPEVHPGVVHSEKLGWDRTEVTAELYQTVGGRGPTPETLEREVATATEILRRGGWTIHWEMCLPPVSTDLATPQPAETIPMQVPRSDGYEWLTSGYKITDGVSYWSLVVGVLNDDGSAFVNVLLRAPNARDPANLFTSEPAAVPADKTCAEDGKVSDQVDQVEQAGTPTMIRDWWPFPGQTRSRDPHQL